MPRFAYFAIVECYDSDLINRSTSFGREPFAHELYELHYVHKPVSPSKKSMLLRLQAFFAAKTAIYERRRKRIAEPLRANPELQAYTIIGRWCSVTFGPR